MGKNVAFFTLGIMSVISLAFSAGWAADKGIETKVVATVNGTTITWGQVQQKLSRGGDKKEILEKMIRGELLYQEALRRGLDKELKAPKKKRDLVKALIKDEEARLQIPQKEIDDYIAKNFVRARKAARLRLRSILVTRESIAQDILKKLSSEGDFAQLAQIYSEDKKTRSKGGDLGYVSQQDLGIEIAKTAFQLKRPGEVSDIIKTPHGYQILQLTDASEVERLEKAARKALIDKYLDQRLTDLLKQLRAKANIVIYGAILNP